MLVKREEGGGLADQGDLVRIVLGLLLLHTEPHPQIAPHNPTHCKSDDNNNTFENNTLHIQK